MNYYLFEHDDINVDLVFEETEIYRFIAMWQAGESVESIANKMNRNPIDIVLLVIDRAEIGEIKKRPNGIFA